MNAVTSKEMLELVTRINTHIIDQSQCLVQASEIDTKNISWYVLTSCQVLSLELTKVHNSILEAIYRHIKRMDRRKGAIRRLCHANDDKTRLQKLRNDLNEAILHYIVRTSHCALVINISTDTKVI